MFDLVGPAGHDENARRIKEWLEARFDAHPYEGSAACALLRQFQIDQPKPFGAPEGSMYGIRRILPKRERLSTRIRQCIELRSEIRRPAANPTIIATDEPGNPSVLAWIDRNTDEQRAMTIGIRKNCVLATRIGQTPHH